MLIDQDTEFKASKTIEAARALIRSRIPAEGVLLGFNPPQANTLRKPRIKKAKYNSKPKKKRKPIDLHGILGVRYGTRHKK